MKFALAGALMLALSGCAAANDWWVEKVNTPIGDAACDIGDGSGNWSPDNGGTCVK